MVLYSWMLPGRSYSAKWYFLSKNVVLKRSAKRFAKMSGINWPRTLYYKRSQIRTAANAAESVNEPGEWFDIVVNTPCIFSEQKKWEIVEFLKLVTILPIRYVCEIGTARGGTLFLLMRASRPDATIISIDLKNPLQNRLVLQSARRDKQRLHLLQQDSHELRTLTRVKKILQGNELDLLFIDGDHSFESVKKDYEFYSPLVTEGGIIGFHDIVPDQYITERKRTRSKSGEVYRYWNGLRKIIRTGELVESHDQDGYGIGIVYM